MNSNDKSNKNSKKINRISVEMKIVKRIMFGK